MAPNPAPWLWVALGRLSGSQGAEGRVGGHRSPGERNPAVAREAVEIHVGSAREELPTDFWVTTQGALPVPRLSGWGAVRAPLPPKSRPCCLLCLGPKDLLPPVAPTLGGALVSPHGAPS